MDFNITANDVKNYFKSQVPKQPKVQTSINKQMTVNNAIATRGGQAPQGAPAAPTSDGFGRTI